MTIVKFLGYVISQEGISINPTKIDTILQWERPKNMMEIHNFLRLVGYYRNFIKDFSKIIAPLTKLTRKDVKFDWDNSCKSTFVELKQRLTSTPILTVPNSQGHTWCIQMHQVLVWDAC